jgi:catechol 2,3-dioxygenase-like lactoylglutathione lyase family enzyme
MPFLLTAVPVLTVDDLDEAIRYYENRLGFDLTWTWGDPPTVASVTRDDVELNLARRGDNGSHGAGAVYVRLTGVDEYHEECRRNLAIVVRPPADQPYGMRDFAVSDPSGNRLEFGEALVE